MLSLLRRMRHGREDGFTLIELMVVVLIIGILAAIAIPVFLNLQQEAMKTSVKSDVRNTVTNVAKYLIANPSAQSLETTVTWEPADAGATGTDFGQLAFAAPVQTLLASNLSSKVSTIPGLEVVVSENNTLRLFGNWQNWRVYGSNAGVANWVYAYYSNAADPSTPHHSSNTDREQWAVIPEIPASEQGGPGSPQPGGNDGENTTPDPAALPGLCATWPELGAAARAMESFYRTSDMIDYYHAMVTGEEEQWIEANPVAQSEVAQTAGVLQGSVGPNGENGSSALDAFAMSTFATMTPYLDANPGPSSNWSDEQFATFSTIVTESIVTACNEVATAEGVGSVGSEPRDEWLGVASGHATCRVPGSTVTFRATSDYGPVLISANILTEEGTYERVYFGSDTGTITQTFTFQGHSMDVSAVSENQPTMEFVSLDAACVEEGGTASAGGPGTTGTGGGSYKPGWGPWNELFPEWAVS